MIIDMHTHIGQDKDTTSQTSEELLKKMDVSGVDYSVSFPFDEKDADLVGASLAIANLNNPRIIPFLRFDPKNMTPEKLKSLLPNFKGVKLHTRAQPFDTLEKRYWPLYEEIASSRKPLLFHTRFGNNPNTSPDHVSLIAEHFPEMKIIIGHFAEGSAITAERAKRLDNLYLETSIMSLTNVRINKIYDVIGADKMLFGSDAPYSDQEIELLKIRKSKMGDEEKEHVFYSNAAALLNI